MLLVVVLLQVQVVVVVSTGVANKVDLLCLLRIPAVIEPSRAFRHRHSADTSSASIPFKRLMK